MRAALLFILLFLAHVGRSPAEAHSSGPGGCSALEGHGLGGYDQGLNDGFFFLEHDGGSSLSPNTRVKLRLYAEGPDGFKGFILKTSAGTLTVKDAMQTKTVSACDGAIGHLSAADKFEVEAYLDLPSTTGTVTVTAELVVFSKMSVVLLTLDIEVVEAWTQVGEDIIGERQYDFLGWSITMNTDGTKMAVGAPAMDGGEDGKVRVFQYDQTKTPAWQQMGETFAGSAPENLGKMVAMSGDGTRVASIGAFPYEVSTRVHEWNDGSMSWTRLQDALPTSALSAVAISRDGRTVAVLIHGKIAVHRSDSDGFWSYVGSNGNNLNVEFDSSYAQLALSANGDYIVVGSGFDEGIMTVFFLDGDTNTWMQRGSVIAAKETTNKARFGYSVTISADGNRVVAGAPGSEDPGGVYTNAAKDGPEPYARVYEWFEGSGYWFQRGNDITMGQPSITKAGNNYQFLFGLSVEMSDDGTVVAVRSRELSTLAGGQMAIHLFRLEQENDDLLWKRPWADIVDDGYLQTDPLSKTSLSLSGDGKYVAIGANEYSVPDTGPSLAGRVRVYKDPSAAAPSPSSPSGSCSSSSGTGGTVTTSGEYTIHTFTSSGTFTVADSALTDLTVDVLVVGGGGAGGCCTGGGGGGGGVLYAASMTLSSATTTVTVGDGGDEFSSPVHGQGGTSAFGYMLAYGGMEGVWHDNAIMPDGGKSGYCTYGSWLCNSIDVSGYVAGDLTGSGVERIGAPGTNSPPVGGGGGGASERGGDVYVAKFQGGQGGDGIQYDISGTATYYGGGGGAGAIKAEDFGWTCDTEAWPETGAGPAGGLGGGGRGDGACYDGLGEPGAANTGGGGGGATGPYFVGGSGVVILRYKSATCSDSGDAAEGGGSQSPSPSTPSPSAQDKKKQAETTRDSILGDISDARVKAKAKLLADAAIAGVKVQRLSAKLTAADEDTACSETFSKAGMSAGDGACVATAASSGKRRSLSAMAYDVELMFSASTVNDDALKAAELELKNNGVEGVMSQTSVDPIAELKTVPGVGTGKLQTFENEASAAAAATAAEAQTPPPPTPPPPPKPNLVLDDDDGTVGLVGKAGLLMATAFAILAM